MIYLIHISILCFISGVFGGIFYVTQNTQNTQINNANIYIYTETISDVNSFEYVLNTVNEFSCSNNNFRINSIVFTNDQQNIPFVDFAICSSDNMACKNVPLISSSGFNNYIIIAPLSGNTIIDTNNIYLALTKYFNLDTYSLQYTCNSSNVSCTQNSDCNDESCDIYYDQDAKLKADSYCSRTNIITTTVITKTQQTTIHVLHYRNVTIAEEPQMIHIYDRIRDGMNYYTFTPILTIFPEPEFIPYDVCDAKMDYTMYMNVNAYDFTKDPNICFTYQDSNPEKNANDPSKDDSTYFKNVLAMYLSLRRSHTVNINIGSFINFYGLLDVANDKIDYDSIVMKINDQLISANDTISYVHKNAITDNLCKCYYENSGVIHYDDCNHKPPYDNCSKVGKFPPSGGYNQQLICPPSDILTLSYKKCTTVTTNQQQQSFDDIRQVHDILYIYLISQYNSKSPPYNTFIFDEIISQNLIDQHVAIIVPPYAIFPKTKINEYITYFNQNMIKLHIFSFTKLSPEYNLIVNQTRSFTYIISTSMTESDILLIILNFVGLVNGMKIIHIEKSFGTTILPMTIVSDSNIESVYDIINIGLLPQQFSVSYYDNYTNTEIATDNSKDYDSLNKITKSQFTLKSANYLIESSIPIISVVLTKNIQENYFVISENTMTTINLFHPNDIVIKINNIVAIPVLNNNNSNNNSNNNGNNNSNNNTIVQYKNSNSSNFYIYTIPLTNPMNIITFSAKNITQSGYAIIANTNEIYHEIYHDIYKRTVLNTMLFNQIVFDKTISHIFSDDEFFRYCDEEALMFCYFAFIVLIMLLIVPITFYYRYYNEQNKQDAVEKFDDETNSKYSVTTKIIINTIVLIGMLTSIVFLFLGFLNGVAFMGHVYYMFIWTPICAVGITFLMSIFMSDDCDDDCDDDGWDDVIT